LTKRDVLDWKQSIEETGGRKDKDGEGNRTIARAAKTPTVNRKLAAVRSFFRWAQEHDLGVRFDPPKPRKRQGRTEPKSLEADERRALLRAVESAGNTRDILLIRCGLEGGLRVSEMAALRWSDVKISDRKGEMRVKGKGGKERTVPLTKSLRNAFVEHGYGRHRGKDKAPFESQRGGRPLSVRGIQDIIEGYGKAARVGKTVGLPGFSAHVLRHTCADWLLNNPDPDQRLTVPEVAQILGHADIKTTGIYLRPQGGRLAEKMARIDD
jgi:integrase